MTGKRSFGGIDVGKLCLAVIVAAVHTLTIESGVPLLNRAWTELQAYPVPFFFLAAGFFLGRRLQKPFSARENRAALTGYLRRMARMYALWSLAYFPFAFPGYLQSAGSAGKAFLDYACDALFFGSYGPFPVLWYLLAAVYAALLLLLLHALRSPDGGVLCAGLAFIVIYRFIQSHIWMSGVQAPALRFLQHAYLATFRSGRVFLGCVYVPIGVFLSRRMPPRPAAAAILALGFGGEVLRSGLPWLALPLRVTGTVGLFSLAASVQTPERRAFYVCRYMSTGIYFTHMLVWYVYCMAVRGALTRSPDAFFAALAVSALLSLGYAHIRLKKKHG